jgi:uncharacterized membrane protein
MSPISGPPGAPPRTPASPALDLAHLRAEVDAVARLLAGIQRQLADASAAEVGVPAARPSAPSAVPPLDLTRVASVSAAAPTRGIGPGGAWDRFVAEGAWRRADWWLSRIGVAFLVLGVAFLLALSLERRVLGPVGRCVSALAIGAALALSARRTARSTAAAAPADSEERAGAQAGSAARARVGLRDLLYGAALAVWFGTSYAAHALYGLVPLGAAQAGMLAVTITGLVLGWRERQEALGVAALAGAYTVPLLLSAPSPSPLAVLGFATALQPLGLWFYVYRAWRFAAAATLAGSALFACLALSGAVDAGGAAAGGAADVTRVATAVLVAWLATCQLAAAYQRYARTPRAERPSLELRSILDAGARGGSADWGPVEHQSLLVLPVVLPVAVTAAAASLWPAGGLSPFARALYALAVATVALVWGARAHPVGRTLRPVALTAAGVWGVLGLVDLTPSARVNLALFATHAALAALVALRRCGPALTRAALVALSLAAFAFVVWGAVEPRPLPTAGLGVWAASLLFAVGGLGWWWCARDGEPDGEACGASGPGGAGSATPPPPTLWPDTPDREALGWTAAAGYAAALAHARTLAAPVTEALVTALWVGAGVGCLVAAHRLARRLTAVRGARRARGSAADATAWLRRTGLSTCFVVAGKLLLVDLAEVETVWRVLVFLICGALFVGVSRWLSDRDGEDASPPGPAEGRGRPPAAPPARP